MHSALEIEANTHMMPEISSVLQYNGAEESFVTRLAHSLKNRSTKGYTDHLKLVGKNMTSVVEELCCKYKIG